MLSNDAFRRSPNDIDGLSVASSHEAAKRLLRSGRGTARFLLLELLALGLDVTQTDADHGYIEGLPPFTDDPADPNYNLATEYADRLLALASKGENITIDPWRRDQ